MKPRKLPFVLLGAALLATMAIIVLNQKSDVEKLREKHAFYLKNSPFKDSKKLSKKERLKLGLPPNTYYEQMWEMTLDPATGRPMPERVYKLQQDLKIQRLNQRGGTGDTFNPWVDRGPNNVGGRTRGIMFDPNDNDFNRVFAGGVSGGLWVNEDITDPNTSWTQVPGIGANISVTTIVYDPNDTNTFYIGSGESFTSGSAVGRGVWKSTDGGVTWNNIFGGPDGTITNSGQVVNGIFYINDIVVRDVGSTSEIYIAVAGAVYASAGNPNNFLGANDQGLYKSTDGGSNWTKFTLNESNGSPSNPNDIELDINNNIWLTTTRSVFGPNGGRIYRSTDGNSFSLIRTIPNARRTELEPSSTDANKFWIAIDNSNTRQADLFFTDDAFATLSSLNEPSDVDTGIPANDYARNQAFYNLPIEVDENDNLYVGGIDLFRSTDEGNNWTQITKWSNNNNLAGLSVPLVHADQHAIVFRPGTGNEGQAVLGNDGGVYYTPDLTVAQASLSITSREKDFNTAQFYYGAIGPSDTNEILYGGTQDNGTIISQGAAAGANGFDDFFFFFSGDGSYSEIDRNGGLTGFGNGEYMIVGSVFVNYRLASPSVSSVSNALATGYDIHTSGNGEGDFINQAELDHVGNILYANTSTSSTNRISRFILGSSSASEFFLTNNLLTESPSAFKVSPFNNNTLLVGTRDSKLLKIENVNTSQNWSNISGGSFLGSISDIEYGQNAQEIFVTVHNYGVTSIWFTEDGGSNWRSIEGDLPDLPVKCILQNPLLPSELIIGTELGVWRTYDYKANSPEWVQAYNGMSDVTVLDLDLRVTDNTVLATTHGRGLFTSQFTASTASIDEVLSDKKQFTVYPIISNGDITIFAKRELGNAKVMVFDLRGSQVYQSNLDFSKLERNPIQLNLRSGIYILSLLDSFGKKSSQKIIIE